ncbi:hypothetical protein Efla_006907 [Eimeria flavescens]
MAAAFGVSPQFIEEEIAGFIASGKLGCRIDKVNGVVEASRPEERSRLYLQAIKQGDVLLSRIQKLARVLAMSGRQLLCSRGAVSSLLICCLLWEGETQRIAAEEEQQRYNELRESIQTDEVDTEHPIFRFLWKLPHEEREAHGGPSLTEDKEHKYYSGFSPSISGARANALTRSWLRGLPSVLRASRGEEAPEGCGNSTARKQVTSPSVLVTVRVASPCLQLARLVVACPARDGKAVRLFMGGGPWGPPQGGPLLGPPGAPGKRFEPQGTSRLCVLLLPLLLLSELLQPHSTAALPATADACASGGPRGPLVLQGAAWGPPFSFRVGGGPPSRQQVALRGPRVTSLTCRGRRLAFLQGPQLLAASEQRRGPSRSPLGALQGAPLSFVGCSLRRARMRLYGGSAAGSSGGPSKRPLAGAADGFLQPMEAAALGRGAPPAALEALEDIPRFVRLTAECASRLRVVSGQLNALMRRRKEAARHSHQQQQQQQQQQERQQQEQSAAVASGDSKELRRWQPPELGDLRKSEEGHLALLSSWGWVFPHEESAAVGGRRCCVLTGPAAKLHGALCRLFEDSAEKEGFQQVVAPLLLRASSLEGTGQLPRLEGEAFRLADRHEAAGEQLYLSPTSEVPLVGLYRGCVLQRQQLPIRLTATTPCFRNEDGSYGSEHRGLYRQRVFYKTERVVLCPPDASEAEHLALLSQVERLLQALELPFRLLQLSDRETGYAAALCYDAEVWMPSLGRFVEVSSISNCRDYQFCHTLNCSALAVGRILAALVENHQTVLADGRKGLKLPPSLRPYFNGAAFLAADR